MYDLLEIFLFVILWRVIGLFWNVWIGVLLEYLFIMLLDWCGDVGMNLLFFYEYFERYVFKLIFLECIVFFKF